MYITLYNVFMVKEEVIKVSEITDEEIDKKIKPKRRKIFNVLWTIFLITAALIAIPMTYVDLTFTPVYIDGISMAPTLNNFDNHAYVEFGLMDERPRTKAKIGRGDIIVFDRNTSGEGAPDLLIKRVIALPNETILINDNVEGDQVYITPVSAPQFVLDEPYLKGNANYSTAAPNDLGNGVHAPLTLGDNAYYLMGDNRANSHDSRKLGAINFSYVRGRLLVIQGYAEGVKTGTNGKAELINRHYYQFWDWRYY